MKLFTLPSLLGAALLSIAALALWTRYGETDRAIFVFEASLAASKDGHVQLYYDDGAGFSEAGSSRLALPRSDRPVLCRLPLPAGRYRALRLDPTDNDGTVLLASPARIVAPDGRVIRTLGFSELVSAEHIQVRRERAGQLELAAEPGGDDPQLTVTFSPPLELRTPLAEVALRRTLAGLGVFLPLAGLLFSLDRRPVAPGHSSRQHLLSLLARPPLWFTVAICAAVLAARRPDAVRTPQFWAEDSIEFYFSAYTAGWAAVMTPYAGYFHAVPRLVAAASLAVDPRWAPAFFVALAGALTLYVAARTGSARCPLPRHAGCALAVVFVPDAFEVLLNVTNLQWILAGGLALLLISSDATRWWQHLHDGLAALLLGLTGPFIVLFAPFFVWRARRRRSRSSVVLAAIVVLAAAVQAWTIWRNPVPQPSQQTAIEALLAVPGMRIGASLLAGAAVPLDYPRPVEIALGLGTLAAVALLAARRGAMRVERVWLAGVFLGLLAISLYRVRGVLPDVCHKGYGSRYFFPLQLIAIWLLLAAAADDRRRLARGAACVALWALAVNIPRLREYPLPDLDWAAYAPKIRAGEAVVVPVNPEPWKMRLPAKNPRD